MKNDVTKVVTGLVRFSYLHCWEPESFSGFNQGASGESEKYSASIIIPKKDVTTIKAIESAIAAATQKGKSQHWGGAIPLGLHNPLRDGDLERPDDPNYANSYFVTARSKYAPGIVDANRVAIPKELRDEVYSGCYGRASLTFYPYNERSKGIGCGLGNIQKLADGPNLMGRSSAENDFSDDFSIDEVTDLL